MIPSEHIIQFVFPSPFITIHYEIIPNNHCCESSAPTLSTIKRTITRKNRIPVDFRSGHRQRSSERLELANRNFRKTSIQCVLELRITLHNESNNILRENIHILNNYQNSTLDSGRSVVVVAFVEFSCTLPSS